MQVFTPKGERSRLHILRVATDLFSRKGFDGTSVDDIVNTASVNKRMVYHYFGTKKGLYQAALVATYSKIETLELETVNLEDAIEKVVPNIVSAYFTFLQHNPDFVRLILWENLREGKNLMKMDAQISKSPVLDLLMKVVEKGQKDGKVRPDIDARFLLISLIGNCMIYYSNRFTLSRTMKMDLESPRVLDKAKKAVSNLLLHGIAPDN